jgi:hypothetical protein
MDDLGTDEDDQLGAGTRFALIGKRIAEQGNLVETRNTVAITALLLADEAGEQHRLSGRDRDRTLHLALGHSGRQAGGAGRFHIADFLLDV